MVVRYRNIMEDPVRTERNGRSNIERRRRKLKNKRLKKQGLLPKRNAGRPQGSKNQTSITFRRMLEAMEDDKILPHEFLLMVINTGLRGGTLGVRKSEGGKITKHHVTFDDMMAAASQGLKYFAAPIRLEHGGPGGGPIQVFHIPADKLEGLETNELRFLQAILPKLGSSVKTIEHQEGDADAYAREIGMLSEKEKT